MNDEKYISSKQITNQFDTTSTTLRRWSDEGKICKKIWNCKACSYQSSNLLCYRVSSNHQKEDLDRQIEATLYVVVEAFW